MQSIYAVGQEALFGVSKSYAPSPVWSGSTRAEVRFLPIPRKQARELHRKLKLWNRVRVAGKRGGSIGAYALAVFDCLISDFLNYKTGRLDPSYDAIANRTGFSRSTIAKELKKLKELGVINWVRRCSAVKDESGVFRLEQDTNAYAILPVSHWIGFSDPVPIIDPTAWGAVPMLPAILDQALLDSARGGLPAFIRTAEDDPGDSLAAALARLGRSLMGRDS